MTTYEELPPVKLGPDDGPVLFTARYADHVLLVPGVPRDADTQTYRFTYESAPTDVLYHPLPRRGSPR